MVLDRDNESNIFSMTESNIEVKDSSLSNIQTSAYTDVNAHDKEFVITELSHEESDLKIQFNRVMYVLRRTIEKLKLVSSLPALIEDDGKLLKQYFDDETVQSVLDVCEKDIVLLGNIGQRSQFRRKDTSPAILRNTKLDQDMVEVIALLYNNQKIKKDVIEAGDIVLNDGATKLIEAMNILYTACEQKLQVNAVEEKRHQKQLRRAWRNNLIVKNEIQNLQSRLDGQRDNFSKDFFVKRKIIEEYQEKMDLVRENFKEKLNKRVAESEKLMGLEAAASEIKIAELTAELKRVQTEHQTLVENHLSYEKSLRAKRLKVETQLATWLAKYDQDIGERFHEIEALTKEYEEKKAKMDTLQTLFDEQQEEFEELMEEKAREDKRLFEIKLYRIMANVAARKIQHAWKRYWERKQARLKAKRARARDKKMGIIRAPRKGVKDKAKKKKKKKELKPDKSKLLREDNAIDDLTRMYTKSNVLEDLSTAAFDSAPVTVEL